jgi:hypothetical protein
VVPLWVNREQRGEPKQETPFSALAGALAFSAGACEGGDSSTRSSEATAPDSFVSIQPQLDEQEAGDLFAVDTEVGTYWRMFALDLFDGSAWSSSDPNATERGHQYTSPAELPEQIGNDTADTSSRSYKFRVLNEIATPWLPIPGRAKTITVKRRRGYLRHLPRTGAGGRRPPEGHGVQGQLADRGPES